MKPKSKLGIIIRIIVTLFVLCVIGRINNVNILLAINGYSVHNYKIVYYGLNTRITDKENTGYSASLYNKPNPLEVIKTTNSKNELCLVPIYEESGFWHVDTIFTRSFSNKNYALLRSARTFTVITYYPPTSDNDKSSCSELDKLNPINYYEELITITYGVDAVKQIDINDTDMQSGEAATVQQDGNEYVVLVTKYFHVPGNDYLPTDIHSLLQTKGMVSNVNR